MLSQLKQTLTFLRHNLPGWRTNQPTVVITSDDWGSVRMPSRKAQERLKDHGIATDKCAFLTFDHFETEDDFDALYHVLRKHQGMDGRHPVVTGNFIMANPDFDSIKASGYERYSRITLQQKLQSERAGESYKRIVSQGMKERLFMPQLHGMEHVNVPYWMKCLQNNYEETLFAFDQGVYGISTNVTSEKRRSYLAELDYSSADEINSYVVPALRGASTLFEEMFGFRSSTFIAPNYVWDTEVERVLADNKVIGLQSAYAQILPAGSQQRLMRRHTGEKNNHGQHYQVRNALFEPSDVKDKRKHLAQCVQNIRLAFWLNRPAIICAHRVNFMGGFSESNRKENLALLNELLTATTRMSKHVRFVSCEELAKEVSTQ